MIVHKSKNCLKCKHMKDCKLSPEGCSQFERVNQTHDKSTNALAELAERLNNHIVPISGCVGSRETGLRIADDIRAAQRIVAELAKANPDKWPMCVQAMIDCRAIAEEGAGDGK